MFPPSWHSTWQLAVTLAEAMNRKNSVTRERRESIDLKERRDTILRNEKMERANGGDKDVNKDGLATRFIQTK